MNQILKSIADSLTAEFQVECEYIEQPWNNNVDMSHVDWIKVPLGDHNYLTVMLAEDVLLLEKYKLREELGPREPRYARYWFNTYELADQTDFGKAVNYIVRVFRETDEWPFKNSKNPDAITKLINLAILPPAFRYR